jgi:nucleoside transport protein
MSILIGIAGILVVLGLAFLMSNDKKNIDFKAIAIMIGLQFLTTWFMFNTTIGEKIVKVSTSVFDKLIVFGNNGINFVFGGLIQDGQFVFFFNVLLQIVFFSTLIAILNYTKILPLTIKYVGGALAKITGVPKLESFSAVSGVFLGQSESMIAIKNYLDSISTNRLYVIAATAMGSVSASILGSYMQLIPSEYVLVSLPLNMFSALIIGIIISPVKVTKEEDKVELSLDSGEKSIFEAMGNGALDGLKVAGIVAGMLIAYIATMDMINWFVAGLSGMKLQEILSYVVWPITVLMGVPVDEALKVGSIVALKVVTNEFVAMLDFTKMIPNLSEKSVAIVSTYLISFANFSSIGIIAGTVKAINGEKSKEVAGFGLKLLIGATLASILSATIVGVFV